MGLQYGGLGRLGVSWACFAAHTQYGIIIFPVFFWEGTGFGAFGWAERGIIGTSDRALSGLRMLYIFFPFASYFRG